MRWQELHRSGILTKGTGHGHVGREGSGQGAGVAGRQALPGGVTAGGVLTADALAAVCAGGGLHTAPSRHKARPHRVKSTLCSWSIPVLGLSDLRQESSS